MTFQSAPVPKDERYETRLLHFQKDFLVSIRSRP